MSASKIEKRTPSWFFPGKQPNRAFSAHSSPRQLSGTFGCDRVSRLVPSPFSDRARVF